MRILFLLLVIANLLFFAVCRGDFGPVLQDGREPGRMSQQFEAQRIHLLGVEQGAKLVAPPKIPQCLEIGGFAGDDVKRASDRLGELALGDRLSTRKLDEQASFIVYLPPFRTRADADRAASELHRVGVSDFFVIQDNSPFRLGISLGVFSNEEKARAQLTNLTQQGVRNAKVGQRVTVIAKTWFQINNPDSDMMARLTDIAKQFPNQELKECVTDNRPTTNSSASNAGAGPAAGNGGLPKLGGGL